jgi:transposase
MEQIYFVGIDISSEFFTVSIYQKKTDNKKTYKNFENSTTGFNQLIKEIQKLTFEKNEITFCMESTGVYGEKLAYFLYDTGHTVAVENPLKVKRSFGISNKKSDAIDSLKIALYAYRFLDELNIWKPKPRIIEEIRILMAQRVQLNKQKDQITMQEKLLRKKSFMLFMPFKPTRI